MNNQSTEHINATQPLKLSSQLSSQVSKKPLRKGYLGEYIDRSLFKRNAMFFQLAKHLVPLGKSGKLEGEQRLFFLSVILLGKAIDEGHSALPLSAYANTQALVDYDIYDCFPDEQQWLDCLLSHAQVLSISTQGLSAALTNLKEGAQALVFAAGSLYIARHAFIEFCLAERFVFFAQQQHSIQQTLARELQQLPTISDDVLTYESVAVANNLEIDWQQIAVNNSLLSPLSVVVGGPGTGKTTTVAKIVEALFAQFFWKKDQGQNQDQCLKIGFAAPTGKAAARLYDALMVQIEQRVCASLGNAAWLQLQQCLPDKAQTLHRLLAWQGHAQQFTYDQNKRLPYNCLIIDEISMIDMSMFYYFLRAVPDNCRLILLGDPKQLASVQSGSVLADICHEQALFSYSSQRLAQLGLLSIANDAQLSQQSQIEAREATDVALLDNISLLRKSYRFDDTQGIGLLAKAILAQDIPACLEAGTFSHTQAELQSQFESFKRGDKQVQYFDRQHFQQAELLFEFIVHKAQNLAQSQNLSEAFVALKAFQLLCIKREGDDSVADLNQRIAEAVQRKLPANYKQRLNDMAIYHGMPVMVQQNLYREGLFNGDMGLVWYDEAAQQLYIVFESLDEQSSRDDEASAYKRYLPMQLSGWQSAHAITVHKSQGSEYNEVALWLPDMSSKRSSDAASKLLNRELFYTAVTRAKLGFICLADEDIISMAVQQDNQRFSNLAQLLNNK